MTDGKEPINPTYWDERNQPSFKIDGGGLDKREYFSAKAMQGLMAVQDKGAQNWDLASIEAAKISVMCADALINELNKAAPPNLLTAAILCQKIIDKYNNPTLPENLQELLQTINETLKAAIK